MKHKPTQNKTIQHTIHEGYLHALMGEVVKKCNGGMKNVTFERNSQNNSRRWHDFVWATQVDHREKHLQHV